MNPTLQQLMQPGGAVGYAQSSGGAPVAGPGLGNNGDYYNQATRQVQPTPTYGPFNPNVLGLAGTSANNVAPHNNPAPTSNPTPNPSSQPTNGMSQEDTYRQQQRDSINSGFNNYLSQLDAQNNLLPEHYKTLQDQVNNVVGGQGSTIDTAAKNSNAQLDNSSQNVDLDKASSLRSLAQNFQDNLAQGNNKLGSVGASDSSAAPMYAYALSQEQNRNVGDTNNQAMKLHNDISLRKNSVANTLADQHNQLDTWKNTQMNDLSNWVVEHKAKIMNAKGVAEQARGEALANLTGQALSRLQQLDDQFTQHKEGISNWAMQHQTALDSIAAYMHQQGAYQPNPIVNKVLNSTIQGAQNNDPSALFGYNPFAKQQDRPGNPVVGQ